MLAAGYPKSISNATANESSTEAGSAWDEEHPFAGCGYYATRRAPMCYDNDYYASRPNGWDEQTALSPATPLECVDLETADLSACVSSAEGDEIYIAPGWAAMMDKNNVSVGIFTCPTFDNCPGPDPSSGELNRCACPGGWLDYFKVANCAPGHTGSCAPNPPPGTVSLQCTTNPRRCTYVVQDHCVGHVCASQVIYMH